MISRLILAGLALAVLPATVNAAETIVGIWAPDLHECTPVGGMLTVQPFGLMRGNEFACSFRDMSRSGEVVT